MKALERRLDLPAVIAISMSAMLGSGIFVLPGLAAAHAGSDLWLAYLLSAFCVLPAALSKSELATAMPSSGGTYVYIDRTFGPLAGTIAGLGLWLSLLLKSCFALVGLGFYLQVLVDVPLEAFSLTLLALIVALNIRGVRGVGRVQLLSVSTSIFALGILILWGLFRAGAHADLRQPHVDGEELTSAVALLFVSYAGVTKIAAVAEEVRKPGQNLPLGMLVSLGAVALLYSGAALTLTEVLPLGELTAPDVRPIHTLGVALFGERPALIVAAIGVVTMASMCNAGLLAASRFPFAMSRDNLLPPFLHQLSPRFLTPTACILLSGATMAVVILTLNVEGIAKLGSTFVILMFVAVNLSVMVLRETGVRWYLPVFRSPGYPWTQVFGILSGGVLLAAMGPLAALAVVVIAIPGLVLHTLYGRHRTVRQGVVGLRGKRSELLISRRPEAEELGTEVPVEGRAAVLVALLGDERSPEMQVDLAAALAEGGKIAVIQLRQVPEQTVIDTALEKDAATSSVERRIAAMAETRGLSIGSDAIATHDVIGAIQEISTRLGCRWLVMEWVGKTRGSFTFRNPLGWLKDHISSNLAIFDDAGIRFIRKILVKVAPGSHDSLVVRTADHLAGLNNADLTFLHFARPGEGTERTAGRLAYLESIRRLCSAPTSILSTTGKNEEKAIGEVSAGFDLLITEEAPTPTLRDRVFGSAVDRLTDAVACSVLRVQSPREHTHEALDLTRARESLPEASILGFADRRCLEARIPPLKKEALFQHFARIFAESGEGLSAEEIALAFLDRERGQNTSVGQGLALPHGTVEGAKKSLLGIFTTEAPVDYGAPDGQGVDVFLVTIGEPSERQVHLVILSAISKMVRQTSLLEELRAAKTGQELLAALERSARELGV